VRQEPPADSHNACIPGPAAALWIRLRTTEPTHDPRTAKMIAVAAIGPKRETLLRMTAPRMAWWSANTPPDKMHLRRHHQKAARAPLRDECDTARQRVKPPKANAV